jgi:hypothetical protein
MGWCVSSRPFPAVMVDDDPLGQLYAPGAALRDLSARPCTAWLHEWSRRSARYVATSGVGSSTSTVSRTPDGACPLLPAARAAGVIRTLASCLLV